jgi:hypothetical protein
MQPIETAQTFYALGVAIIPVHHRGKTPDLLSWRQYQKNLPTPSSILSWFSKESNIGVVTGWKGLLVLDFDEHTTYTRWLWWATKQGRFSLASRVAKTAYRVSTSRGVHVYVWSSTPERNRKLPGIDIKARNGYVLGEGSIHPTGKPYRALTPGLIIPRIETLSDVLPLQILLDTEQPEQVQLPHNILSNQESDPWMIIDNQVTITAHLVDSIKAKLRIEDLLPHGEATSGDGRWHRTKCPLHDDDDPSFWIDRRNQLCGCFAGCTPKPLDVVNLYARLHGLNNRDAIFALQKVLA